MSFLFNFPIPDDALDAGLLDGTSGMGTTEELINASSPPKPEPSSSTAVPFREHYFSVAHASSCADPLKPGEFGKKKCEPPTIPEYSWNGVAIGRTTLQFVCPEFLQSLILQDTRGSVLMGIANKLDIVPGVYEGGFRVWDGACDMLAFLTSNSSMEFSGKKVLELGCGAGLPGIYALLHGAIVHFQDYNSDVIELATATNVRHNLETQDQSNLADMESCVKLFSGDWIDLVQHLGVTNENESTEISRYDIILTSDTVYRKDVLQKLCSVLPKLLKKTGSVFVAGKSHYFGLDGGTDEFRKELIEHRIFEVVESTTYPDSVRREILTVRFADQKS